LITAHILEPWNFLHGGEQLRSPGLQIGQCVSLDGVLVKGIARAAADAQVLLCLEKG